MRFALNFITYYVGYIVGICLKLLGFAGAIKFAVERDGLQGMRDDCHLTDEELEEMIARMNEDGPNN